MHLCPLSRSLALAASALAFASGLGAQDLAAAPRWHAGIAVTSHSSLLLGPSVAYSALATSRAQLLVTASALWATNQVRPFNPVCDDPMQRPGCSNAPAASRLLSVGLEGRMEMLADVYVVAALSGVDGWWGRPVVGRHQSAQAALGLGVPLFDSRSALEVRAQTEGSTSSRVRSILLVWRLAR